METNWLGLLLFAVISVLGWRIFARLKIPAASVLGGTFFVAVANILSVPLYLPSWLRLIMSVNLGISIGSKFYLDVGPGLKKSLALFVPLIMGGSLLIGLGMTALGLDKVTAMFSALLGGLTEMAFIAQEFNFDSFQVSIFQTFRMCALLIVMPLIARRMPVPELPAREKKQSLRRPEKWEWVVLAVGALLTGWALGKLHIPAGKMLGSMAFTVAFSRLRRIKPRLNPTWHSGVLSFIGGSTGMSVTAASILALPTLLLPLCGYVVMMILISAAGYLLLRRTAKLDPRTALFCATMGGLSPSIALAESMGGDSSVVSSFQVVRYFSVIALALLLGYVL